MKVPNEYRITIDKVDMIRKIFDLPNPRILKMCSDNSYGNNGMFFLPREGKKGFYFLVQASDGQGWEHVSVSIPSENRTPTWEEMCYIKSMFWSDDDCVLQYHPPKSDYINRHEYCLHLWRPVAFSIPVPDTILV